MVSEGEHFAEWKETEPVSREVVAAELSKAPAELSSQEILVAGMLRPAHLLDIVRNFTLQMPIKGRTVKVVARFARQKVVFSVFLSNSYQLAPAERHE